MNKQELIKHIEGLPYTEGFFVDTVRIGRSGLLKLINQLDEPQKVMIPRFIADWIVQAKEDGYNIAGAINEAPRGAVDDWLELENVDIFAEAWVNGYEIEKEKRYTVKMKNLRALFCYLAYIPDEGYWTFMASGGKSIVIKHTHKELEEAGFGEVFNSPLFEVEEVE